MRHGKPGPREGTEPPRKRTHGQTPLVLLSARYTGMCLDVSTREATGSCKGLECFTMNIGRGCAFRVPSPFRAPQRRGLLQPGLEEPARAGGPATIRSSQL